MLHMAFSFCTQTQRVRALDVLHTLQRAQLPVHRTVVPWSNTVFSIPKVFKNQRLKKIKNEVNKFYTLYIHFESIPKVYEVNVQGV